MRADLSQQPAPTYPVSTEAETGRWKTKDDVLVQAIEAFESWLDANGDSSFDPYDVWGTRYGLKARRLYYSKNLLGLPSSLR